MDYAVANLTTRMLLAHLWASLRLHLQQYFRLLRFLIIKRRLLVAGSPMRIQLNRFKLAAESFRHLDSYRILVHGRYICIGGKTSILEVVLAFDAFQLIPVLFLKRLNCKSDLIFLFNYGNLIEWSSFFTTKSNNQDKVKLNGKVNNQNSSE